MRFLWRRLRNCTPQSIRVDMFVWLQQHCHSYSPIETASIVAASFPKNNACLMTQSTQTVQPCARHCIEASSVILRDGRVGRKIIHNYYFVFGVLLYAARVSALPCWHLSMLHLSYILRIVTNAVVSHSLLSATLLSHASGSSSLTS